jgi:hypothetical protein
VFYRESAVHWRLGQAQQEVAAALRILKQRLCSFVFIKVDFNKRLILLAKFANDKGFANLTCASNRQCLFS